MKKDILKYFKIKETAPLVDAMGSIDKNGKRIVFAVDSNGHLNGSLTDGDIRRWIFNGGDIHASVKDVMEKHPICLFEDEKNKAQKIMQQKGITAIPIIDNIGFIRDIVVEYEEEVVTNIPKESMSSVPCIMMAGGKATRLYPYTKILPKPLIPIGDTPIIERIINLYTKYGINQFYITVNYKKEMIKSYFGDMKHSYDIKYVEEDKPLGTAGSIGLIDDAFVGPVFVTNSDALILADYCDIYNHHVKVNNDITIVSSLKNITVPYGVLNTKEDGEVVSMEEKPRLSYFINTGMYVVNPNILELIPNDTMFHMTDLVQRVMERGGKVGMYPVSEDSFLDMGEISEMQRMEEKLDIAKG